MTMKMKTKGQMLEYLAGLKSLALFNIPDLFLVSSDKIHRDTQKFFKDIYEKFGKELLVVRSSANDEDTSKTSRAGEYRSILKISSTDHNSLISAVKTVINSYGKHDHIGENNEVLIQKMVTDVSMSGVIFTHDLDSGAPYYVINYDDYTGKTNTVTSGSGEYSNRTLHVYRKKTKEIRSDRFNKLIDAVVELENILENNFLDIEFAMDKDLKPYLLQVRPITTKTNWNTAANKTIGSRLDEIQGILRKSLGRVNGVYGKTTVFGQMPDWNPAEMIGRAPRALARSLYEKMITNYAWCHARKLMGYTVPTDHPLMISLAGQPFVDVRLSFHSFLPKGLSSTVSNKLVDAWINKLKDFPELHDKIEFDVAITAFSFDIDKKLMNLVGDLLDKNEKLKYRDKLKKMTLHFLKDSSRGSIKNALSFLSYLPNNTQLKSYNSIDTLPKLIDKCIKYGAIPFAILARHGFVATSLLNSLVERGIFSRKDVANFFGGTKTVANDFIQDLRSLRSDKISKDYFLNRYGHLRAGTYDICSLRYDQIPELLEIKNPEKNIAPERNFVASKSQKKEVNLLIKEENIKNLDCDAILRYCSTAIAGREYGKFIFTRAISAILEIIANFGQSNNLTREQMSHIPLDNLLNVLHSSPLSDPRSKLLDLSKKEAKLHSVSTVIRLPQLIYDKTGAYVTPFQVSHPNFITSQKVAAKVIILFPNSKIKSLNDHIVLIENADPGFDWIFTQKIVGLITKYGGANSHMAVRCAEFGIPAAIGCGEQRFETFLKCNWITLDCSAGLISIQ